MVSQFKGMACMEPYFYLNHEILTLDFQKPKPVTDISEGLPRFSCYIWKGLGDVSSNS